MSRPNPLILFTVLFGVAGVLSWLALRPGALLIAEHEGDTYHLLDILFRMQQGQFPHQDFMTPIGILAFLPIDVFLSRGFGVGFSILYAQVFVFVVLSPLIFYVAWSRLSPKTAYVFAAFSAAMILAISFGGPSTDLAISMHYNRWAWAVTYSVIVLAFLQPVGARWPVLDGILIGLCLGLLVLTKITFFVALVPGIAAVLLKRGESRMLLATIAGGLLVAAVASAFLGIGYWFGYAADLLAVSSSEIRPYPSASIQELIGSAETFGLSIIAFLAFLLVRRSDLDAEALGLVLLIPGFFYITYQNYGNDPKWLFPIAVLLIMLRPALGEKVHRGLDLRIAMTSVATAALLLFLPSAMNMVLSPVRHSAQDISDFSPLLPAQPDHLDIATAKTRATTVSALVQLDVEGSVWFDYREAANRADLLTLNDIEFPECQLMAGTQSWFDALSNELARLNTPEGSQLFVADILAAFWLFGPYEPLQGGAPWYYGNLSGLENADYLVIPKCGFVPEARNIIIGELIEAELQLTTIADTELMALFTVDQP